MSVDGISSKAVISNTTQSGPLRTVKQLLRLWLKKIEFGVLYVRRPGCTDTDVELFTTLTRDAQDLRLDAALADYWARSDARRYQNVRPRLLGASLAGVIVGVAVAAGASPAVSPRAQAAPAPEAEYVYDVLVRRHFNFPNDDAIGYGHGICDKVNAGEGFAGVMRDVKADVTPNDEFAANYLISYAVSLLCPAQIWQLRNSAAGYRPLPGSQAPTSGLQGGAAGR